MAQPIKYPNLTKNPPVGYLPHQGDDGQRDDKKEEKSFAREAAEWVAGDVVGENFVPPPWRWWDEGRSGRRAEATGTGKQWSDVPVWTVDFANNGQYLPRSLVNKVAAKTGANWLRTAHAGLAVTPANAGKLGGNVASFMAPNWIGNSLANKSGLVRGTANIGAGVGAGVAIGVGGEVLASVADDVSEQMQDLEAARYYGDVELQKKIMQTINSRKTTASNTRSLAHAASTGAMVGPKGAAVGTAAGLGVVAASRAMGGEVHMDMPDKEFYDGLDASMRMKINASLAGGEGMPIRNDQRIDADHSAEFIAQKIHGIMTGQKAPETFEQWRPFVDKLAKHGESAETSQEYKEMMAYIAHGVKAMAEKNTPKNQIYDKDGKPHDRRGHKDIHKKYNPTYSRSTDFEIWG